MSGYHKLPVAQKAAVARDRQREPSLTCPTCAAQVMPAELAAHQVERCTGELPEPHPLARWLTRVEALRNCTAPKLDAWVAAGLVRQRQQDGRYLQRDLAIVVAWARALEAL